MIEEPTPTPQHQNKSPAGLLSEALNHITSLVRKEVDLARAEISQNVTRAGVAVGLLVAAIVAALTALNVLAAALVAGLNELGLGAGWSALIVGAGFAIVAAILVIKGVNDLKAVSIAPTRTAENVKKDVDAVANSTTRRAEHDRA